MVRTGALVLLGLRVVAADWSQDFVRDGVAVVPSVLSKSGCDELRRRMTAMLAAWDPGAQQSVFRTDGEQHVSDAYFFGSAETVSFFLEPDAVEPDGAIRSDVSKDQAVNKAGHALHVRDPLFRAYAESDAVLDVVRKLNYSQPVLPQSMYIFKQPRIGGAVTSHQDATFLYTTPRQTVVGLWLALEDATLENGCLWARKGSHREPVRRHFRRKELVADGEVPEMTFENFAAEIQGDSTAEESWAFEGIMPDDVEKAGFTPLPVKKGDLVVVHGQLDHLSLPNTSPHSRHTFQLHLIEGPRAGITWHKGNWLQYRDGKPFPVMYDAFSEE